MWKYILSVNHYHPVTKWLEKYLRVCEKIKLYYQIIVLRIPTELLMSHMGDNFRNTQDTKRGLMDEIETKTKFDAKCMCQIQYKKVDKNKKRNTVSIPNIFPIDLLLKKKKTAKHGLKFNCAFACYYRKRAK